MALTKVSLVDLNAGELILDLDADTSITSDTDDTIHFKIGGSDEITITGTALSPSTSDGNALGTSALEWSDLFLADGAVINFGDDQDVSLTHVADTGLLLSSTDQLQFGDSGTYIHQSADGVLDLVSDTEIEINATTIDVNGNLDVSGTIVGAGALTAATSITVGSAVLTEAELETLDGVTVGTAIASKVVTTDANIDTTGQRNLTISGELDAATGDFSGDVDIDGTANLDTVDIDGATQIDATVTVGVDDTGYDVKFFGATSGAHLLWDESVDDLILAGAARVVVPEGNLVLGSTAVTSTAAELNLLDGVSGLVQADLTKLAAVDSTATELNIVDGGTSVGTTAFADGDGIVTNDNGTMRQTSATTLKTYMADLTLTTAAQTNITSVGTLTALTVDNMAMNGNTLTTTSADYVIDASHDIILDAAGNEVIFKNAGTEHGRIVMDEAHLKIKSTASDADVFIQGNDGGTGITALRFDMSAAGAATFNDKIIATELDISGDIDVDGTANLDVVDIDGAVDMASTLQVAGAVNLNGGAFTFNEAGADLDFRVEASGHTHALFVEGSTGHVGIGTQTDPNHPLHVGGDENYLISAAQSGTNVNMMNLSSNGASLDIVCDGANNFVRINSATNGDDMKFATNDGNVRMTLLAGGGMTFNGDTAAANALDDYEEGTWTPVLTDGTNDATMHSLTGGVYTKIGRMVQFSANVRTTSLGSVSGNIRVKGLPFATANTNGNHSAAATANAENMDITADTSIHGYISKNADYVRLDSFDDAGGVTVLQASEFSSDGQIVIGGTYSTA